MTALTASAYPIASIPKRFRGFDDHGGGLDDRDGQTAWLEFQFACGLGTHQGDDGVRAELPVPSGFGGNGRALLRQNSASTSPDGVVADP